MFDKCCAYTYEALLAKTTRQYSTQSQNKLTEKLQVVFQLGTTEA